MCVQFISKKSLTDLAKEYSAELNKEFEWKEHIFPRYAAPVIVEKKGQRLVVPMNFGLIPSFEREEKPKMVFHNARSETLKEKASFKKPYLEGRCLIPVNSFFEYVDSEEINPKTKKPKKKLIEFMPSDSRILTAAGIWSLWRHPVTNEITANFSIITREPPAFIEKHGHDRCPYFLKPENLHKWISPEFKTYEALDQFLTENCTEIDWVVK